MNFKLFSFFSIFIICLNSIKLNGQIINVNYIEYANGNTLSLKNEIYELKSKDNKIIEVWNREYNMTMNEIHYNIIFKNDNGKKKVGLFNPNSGKVIIPAIYDMVKESNDNKFVITQIGQKFGFVNLENVKTLEPIYDFLYSFTDGKYIINKNNTGYIINEKLEIMDSVISFKTLEIIHKQNEFIYAIVNLTSGITLIDSENKTIDFNKDWIKINGDFFGSNLIISTKEGWGIYNYKTKKVLEPLNNITFTTKTFYDEQALFEGNRKWKLFDSSGKKLLIIVADSVIPAIDSEWRGFFYKENALWGLKGINGNVVQTPIWKNIFNTRLENFEGVLSNGNIIQYSYEYKEENGRLIISKVIERPILIIRGAN